MPTPRLPDAIVLCGGAGLRLRAITGDAPKSLACIGERPFLEILLSQLLRHGFQRVILAAGFQGELIRSHFGGRVDGLTLEYSVESEPLGTGGALRKAADYLESERALIMNGDSYTNADLSAFVDDACEADADSSMILVPADDRVDCGSVSVDAGGRVLAFREKQSMPGTQFANAGIYMVTRHILGTIPPGVQISLEKELFPQWLAEGKYLRAFRHSGVCIDIGTPARYQNAQVSLENVEDGESPSDLKVQNAGSF